MVTVFIRTVIVYFFLILSIRAMGKRQLGELEVSELVITLMISELAVLPISDKNISLAHGILPILTLLSTEVIMSKLIATSAVVKRFFCGTPSIVIKQGEIIAEELEKARISADELMSELRQNGCPGISDVEYAIIESNGKLSVIMSSKASAPSASELGIKVKERGIEHGVIVNSKTNSRSLMQAGKDENWLTKELTKRGLKKENIWLMTVSDDNEIRIFKKKETKQK